MVSQTLSSKHQVKQNSILLITISLHHIMLLKKCITMKEKKNKSEIRLTLYVNEDYCFLVKEQYQLH